MTNKSEESESQENNKKKYIIIGLVVTSLLIISLLAFIFLGGQASDTVPEQEVDQQLIYISLAKPFIFNVTGDKRNRLVQVKVQLMVRGSKNEQLAREHLPLVEHSLLSAFAAAKVEELRTSQGQLEIRKSAANLVKEAMEKVTGKPVVDRVLFTGFVMQ